MIMWGLAAAMVGCGGVSEPLEADLAVDDDAADEAGGGSATSTSGGAHDVDGGDGGAGTHPSATDEWGDSSGGVEDSGFGMSDDMPLVADIPDIKRGEVPEGTWITIEQVRPSSGRAELDLDAWFYVQDPTAEEHMGLRVALQPGDAMPAQERWVDLVGYVDHDEQGWRLELESAVEGGLHSLVAAPRVRIAALTAADAGIFDDSVVHVVEPALVVTRSGSVPGTLLVGPATGFSGFVIVDLRPFGLDGAMPPPGTPLSRLRGVVEIGGPRPVILPRSTDDLLVAG
jgi:hypothetical protein